MPGPMFVRLNLGVQKKRRYPSIGVIRVASNSRKFRPTFSKIHSTLMPFAKIKLTMPFKTGDASLITNSTSSVLIVPTLESEMF